MDNEDGAHSLVCHDQLDNREAIENWNYDEVPKAKKAVSLNLKKAVLSYEVTGGMKNTTKLVNRWICSTNEFHKFHNQRTLCLGRR